MKFPETKIGELAMKAEDWLAKEIEDIVVKPSPASQPPPPPPPKIPLPPRLRTRYPRN